MGLFTIVSCSLYFCFYLFSLLLFLVLFTIVSCSLWAISFLFTIVSIFSLFFFLPSPFPLPHLFSIFSSLLFSLSISFRSEVVKTIPTISLPMPINQEISLLNKKANNNQKKRIKIKENTTHVIFVIIL